MATKRGYSSLLKGLFTAKQEPKPKGERSLGYRHPKTLKSALAKFAFLEASGEDLVVHNMGNLRRCYQIGAQSPIVKNPKLFNRFFTAFMKTGGYTRPKGEDVLLAFNGALLSHGKEEMTVPEFNAYLYASMSRLSDDFERRRFQ